MKVVVDARPAFGAFRGVGSYIINLAAAMGRVAPEVEMCLVNFGIRGAARPEVGSATTRCVHLRIPNRVVARVAESKHGTKWLRRLPWGFDLAHEAGFEDFPFGRRLVFTLHDVIMLRVPETSAKRARGAEEMLARRKRAAARASIVVADSECSRRDGIELLGLDPERTRAVLLGGPPLAPPRTEAEIAANRRDVTALGIHGDYVLSVGDVIARKNNIAVVRALPALSATYRRNLTFVVVGHFGDASVVTELREEAQRLGVSDRVKLLGYVEAGVRESLLAEASAVVYPTVYEGFGLPVLEAMARSVPVVASNNSSIPEVAGDAALLVDRFRDPEAWADAIEKALGDRAWRADAIERGRARVRTLTWERTAQQTLECYRLALQQ